MDDPTYQGWTEYPQLPDPEPQVGETVHVRPMGASRCTPAILHEYGPVNSALLVPETHFLNVNWYLADFRHWRNPRTIPAIGRDFPAHALDTWHAIGEHADVIASELAGIDVPA
jgi:hypothetical protein